jgi:uncharacterized protein DUF3602
MAGEVSHGRGGAGNINPDDNKYVDGEVTRAGPEGSHADGAFSTGRGGEFDCPLRKRKKHHNTKNPWEPSPALGYTLSRLVVRRRPCQDRALGRPLIGQRRSSKPQSEWK